MKNLMLSLFFLPLFSTAQLSHTVKSKESLYSLARKYNIHPRELASYNNISVETGLSIGQVLRIPSKPTMEPLGAPEQNTVIETKKNIPAPVEKSTAVYHKVAKKETLYSISKQYEPISIEDLKKWNGLTGDALSEGTVLIVGYSSKTVTPEVKPTEIKKEEPAVMLSEKKPEPELKKEAVIVQNKPVKQEASTEIKTPVKQSDMLTDDTNGLDIKGDFFRDTYINQTTGRKQAVTENGMTGVFKSSSGWEDSKFYCLFNGAASGTVVKLTNPLNQRSVYAKVLDNIPDLKQNEGMVIRISNAAAAALGTESDSFETIINYLK